MARSTALHRTCATFALLAGLLARPPAAASAEILSASTCRSVTEPGTVPSGVTRAFPADAAALHAVVVLDAVAGTRVRGTWVAVDAIATPDHPIDSAEVTVRQRGHARVHFQVTRPDAGWPPGRYRLDVHVDGKIARRLPFKVTAATGARAAKPAGLTGGWRCSNAMGTSSLEFLSRDRLSYNGETLRYALVPGAIRVAEEDGPADYRYRLDGDRLEVTFPEGDRMSCTRVAAAAGPKAPAPAPARTGANALLRGNFCSWGGSSGPSSSYGRSTRTFFDGQGTFSYRSESSFSSEAGLAAGRSGVAQGSYRVEGNRVVLRFADGSSGVATVFNRARDGRITELKYQGSLFAPQLCD